MSKARILIFLGIVALVGINVPIALADVITPEMEQLKKREESLKKAMISSCGTGTFQQQLAAADALDKLCARSYHPYGGDSLSAKRWIADIYWRNGQPARGKDVLASFYAGFDKEYREGVRKIEAKKPNADGVMDYTSGHDDPFFSMTFYKSGPGSVGQYGLIGLLICLSDLCTAAGQTQEASTYLSLAGQAFKQNGSQSYSRGHSSWANSVSEAKLSEHPYFSELNGIYIMNYRDKRTSKTVEHLKLMLAEASKFGGDNMCVGQSLWELGRVYEGAQAEPYLKRATEIYWKNGSPEASRVAENYIRCMQAQNREQDGKKFLDKLKAGSSPAKKQASAATTTARR